MEDKRNNRKSWIGRSLRGLLTRKRESQNPPSKLSDTFDSYDTESIKKYTHNPSISVQEAPNETALSGPADVGALLYADASLHATNVQSQQSLGSHTSRPRFASDRIDSQNEANWRMAHEIAVGMINENERSQINSGALSFCTVYSVLEEANKARAERDEDKWRYTKKNGEVVILRERFAKYASSINIVIQHQPDVTGIVWGAARMLIQIYLNHKESIEILEDALKMIAASLFRDTLNKHSTGPETPTGWEKQLETALPEFYAAVLVFSVKAKGYFTTTSRITNSLRPFPKTFLSYLVQLENKEKALKELATMATMDGIKGMTILQDICFYRYFQEFAPTVRSMAQAVTIRLATDNETYTETQNYARASSRRHRRATLLEPLPNSHIRRKIGVVTEMKGLFVQISDKDALKWLDAIPPDSAYDFNKDRRLDGTCEWIFKTEKYKSWMSGTGKRDIWVVGIPGAGKSVLATSLIDELRESTDLLTLYFFFRDGDKQTVSPVEMVASIIAQLINSKIDTERLMRILKLRVESTSYFTKEKDQLRDIKKLSATLIEMLRGFPMPVVVLLDALDECTDPSSVVKQLMEPATNPSSIASLMLMPSIGTDIPVRFVLTGRPNVHEVFAPLPYVATIDMDVNEDIRKFISKEVATNESLRQHESQIIATIYENSQGRFRYAALVLEELDEPSPKPIAERLKAMPKGITGMYELILRRLGAKGSSWEHKMRRKVLLWVTLAERPITVAEMQYAWVTLDGEKSFNPDVAVLPTDKRMLASCGPLLEIDDQGRLHFTHRTVKEFLLQPLDKLSEQSRDDERVTSYMVDEVEGRAWMAMTCVTQLFSNKLTPLESSDKEAEGHENQQNKLPPNSPFNYAVSFWLKHAMDVPRRDKSPSISKALWQLVQDFFWDNNGAAFMAWLRVFTPHGESWHIKPRQDHQVTYRCLFDLHYVSKVRSCIHVAASYGLIDILGWTHPNGLDFDVRDDWKWTPLMWAAVLGDEDAVAAILSKDGVDLNGTTCGSLVAIEGCTRAICGTDGSTALMVAIMHHRFGGVELVLRKPGIDVDLLSHGNTALGCARKYGDLKSVELLISTGAKVSMWEGEVI
ncbi:hypothetical protein CPB86DRAFT_878135 [Serendipita vermifera]|nr:hypothetical protein CPB86DRAFT_878135 [Serendipita vermifera]